jgi:hypothetical protein
MAFWTPMTIIGRCLKSWRRPPLMGVVEIIHMPFVTPIAQRYLHLGNTLKNSLQPK